MKPWLYLGVAIIAEVTGTLALKASNGFSKLLPSVVVVLGYGTAFYLLSLAFHTIPVGIAYAVWSGIGVTLITVAAWIVFGQRLDVPALVGIGLIVAGVVVLNVFSKATIR